jgi:site-specific DNA-methyltransferase (adenine-specific)
MSYQLIHGDCLEVMPTLESESVDAIICDLPYGTTNCHWDSVIPFHEHITFKSKTYTKDEFYLYMTRHEYSREEIDAIWSNGKRDGLWENYKRIIKPRGAIVLFGSQPFTSALIMSNIDWFKYEWIWKKTHATGQLNLNVRPMTEHENICVFASGKTTYNLQMTKKPKDKIRAPTRMGMSDCYGAQREYDRTVPIDMRSPTTVLQFGSVNHGERGYHPTQKPVDLLAYLIRTYTNEGETILDNTTGSGSTIVAAIQEGRNAIGIERDADYFTIAQRRCLEATYQPSLFTPQPTQWEPVAMFGDD